MLAVFVNRFEPDAPLDALNVGERPAPPVPDDGWTVIDVRAASLNHHDLWTLRGGAGLSRRGGAGVTGIDLPRILGSDAAGFDEDGRPVVVYPMINSGMLSGAFDGSFAERLAVPRENLIPLPDGMTFEDAACLPTAWLTAYRMLFGEAHVGPGDTVLIQGAGGGLSTALIVLGRAAGLRVWVTSRSENKRTFALRIGAHDVFPTGARLPTRVDAVMDSVGAATWPHSLKTLRKGGTMVVPGGTSGYEAEADIGRIFAMNLRIVGSAMGTLDQMRSLVSFCALTGIRPPVDRVLPLAKADDGFAAMVAGELRGKVVFTP